MKKNVLFVLFGATILLTMNACKSDELDLDKELKFSKLTVEEQKASIEQNGLDFVAAMEDIQDTKAMTTIMNMLQMTGSNTVSAPMQKLSSDVKNARIGAFSNFDKQMRVSYIDSEVWGEYAYNFDTKEIEKTGSLTNKLIVRFPSTETGTANNAVITVTYEESTVEIPETGEMYPSKMTFNMKVDGAEVMSADFSGSYYSDGAPKKVTQSLQIDVFKWTAAIENDKKTASESYEFKKGTKTILKSMAEVKGTLTESAITDAASNGTPENAIKEFAVFFQIMDVAVKGGTADFKGFATEAKALDYDKMTEKEYMQKTADILNKYMVCTAYFVDADRKFADVELYVVEYTDEYGSWDPVQQKYTPTTYYDLAPRFILSDGSKVAVENYVLDGGFEDIIKKLQDMSGSLEY